MMKLFEHVTDDGKVIGRFYLPTSTEVSQREGIVGMALLHDTDGKYGRLKVGELIRFTGQTWLKRTEREITQTKPSESAANPQARSHNETAIEAFLELIEKLKD